MRIQKNSIFLALLIGTIGIASCGGSTPSDTSADIAGDKSKLADLIGEAHDRGTLLNGLTTAMEDSAVAEEVYAAAMANPMLARRFESSTEPTASTSSGTAARSSGTTARNSTAPKKDILDKTEENVQKANERLDQAARVKQGAEEAKKKVEGIFK